MTASVTVVDRRTQPLVQFVGTRACIQAEPHSCPHDPIIGFMGNSGQQQGQGQRSQLHADSSSSSSALCPCRAVRCQGSMLQRRHPPWHLLQQSHQWAWGRALHQAHQPCVSSHLRHSMETSSRHSSGPGSSSSSSVGPCCTSLCHSQPMQRHRLP